MNYIILGIQFMITIVLVDDERNWLEIVETLVKNSLSTDLKLVSFTNPEEALELIKESFVDCVICDYLIPNHMTGLDMYYRLQEFQKSPKFILISNSKIPQTKIKEIVQKDIFYLPKSFLVVKNFMKKHLEDILFH